MKNNNSFFNYEKEIREVPEEILELFETATKGKIEDFKHRIGDLADSTPELFFELLEGLDWNSEVGLDFIRRCGNVYPDFPKDFSDILTSGWRNNTNEELIRKLAKKVLSRYIFHDDHIIIIRTLVCICWCNCYCCCNCCWPPKYCCSSSNDILVFPKNGNENSYIRARRIRFSGENVSVIESQDRSDEAVIEYTSSGINSINWDNIQNKPDIIKKIVDNCKENEGDSYDTVCKRLKNNEDKIDSLDIKINSLEENINTLNSGNFITNHKHISLFHIEMALLSDLPSQGLNNSPSDSKVLIFTIDEQNNPIPQEFGKLKVLIYGYDSSTHKPIVFEIQKDENGNEIFINNNDNTKEIHFKMYQDGIHYDKDGLITPWDGSTVLNMDLVITLK